MFTYGRSYIRYLTLDAVPKYTCFTIWSETHSFKIRFLKVWESALEHDYVKIIFNKPIQFNQDGARALAENSTTHSCSLVVGLFLETCCPFHPWICSHKIHIFGGVQTRLQMLEERKKNTAVSITNFTAKILHWIASNMRKGVNACMTYAVDICSTGYNFFSFSDFNVIYFLRNGTCVRNGLPDFSNTFSQLWNMLSCAHKVLNALRRTFWFTSAATIRQISEPRLIRVTKTMKWRVCSTDNILRCSFEFKRMRNVDGRK